MQQDDQTLDANVAILEKKKLMSVKCNNLSVLNAPPAHLWVMSDVILMMWILNYLQKMV